MRILVVAMLDSVHTARWLREMCSSDIRIQLFPSTPHRRLHPEIRRLLINENQRVTLGWIGRWLAVVVGIADLLVGNRIRARILSRLIEMGNFDLVHLHETQHAGYIFERLLRKSRNIGLPVVLSLWGSDLVWFANKARHKRRIQRLLRKTSLLFVECSRDAEIACHLGFVGQTVDGVPASGGLSRKELEQTFTNPSERTAIVIKGYTGFVGRAHVAMRVVRRIRHQLGEYQVFVYSASWQVRLSVLALRRFFGIRIVAFPKKSLSHQEVMNLMERARVSISLSDSDGLPGSLREAAIAGAFPIESRGSCSCEWVDCETAALVVDPNDIIEVESAVVRCLNDDQLVDKAFRLNQEISRKLDPEMIRVKILDGYSKLLNEPKP